MGQLINLKKVITFTVLKDGKSAVRVALRRLPRGLSKDYMLKVDSASFGGAVANDIVLEGEDAVDRRDFAEALKKFGIASDSREPHAQYALGRLFERGAGLAQPDRKRAVELITKAASQHYIPAEHYLICRSPTIRKIMLDLERKAAARPERANIESLIRRNLPGIKKKYKPELVDLSTSFSEVERRGFTCSTVISRGYVDEGDDDDDDEAKEFVKWVFVGVRQANIYFIEKLDGNHFKVSLMDFDGNAGIISETSP